MHWGNFVALYTNATQSVSYVSIYQARQNETWDPYLFSHHDYLYYLYFQFSVQTINMSNSQTKLTAEFIDIVAQSTNHSTNVSKKTGASAFAEQGQNQSTITVTSSRTNFSDFPSGFF